MTALLFANINTIFFRLAAVATKNHHAKQDTWHDEQDTHGMMNKTHDMMNKIFHFMTTQNQKNFSTPSHIFHGPYEILEKIVEIFLHRHIHRLGPIPSSQNTLKTNPKADSRIVKPALKTHQKPHSDAFKKGFVLIFLKKVSKKFGGFRIYPYLCTVKRKQHHS